ncbi:MAG TPA: TetR/AcrR family transcriptional regulator [Solirubrobacteraceae bacterium]
MPRPKQRTPELRDHVLAVALQLLARDGVSGFTARGLAREADTSTPAVYELFGDKAGLVREVFFAGFRLLHEQLDQLVDGVDPRADLLLLCDCYRAFITANPTLAEVMFSRPFSDFEPSDDERQASASVRLFVLARVRRCIEAGVLQGDETDIAHVLVALVQGLALAENARRLGRGRVSVDRRWALALEGLLDGLRPSGQDVG